VLCAREMFKALAESIKRCYTKQGAETADQYTHGDRGQR